MIISHAHKFVFIKTHRTASSSLHRALEQICLPGDVIVRHRGNRRPDLPPGLLWQRKSGHSSWRQVRQDLSDEQWDQYYKFCFVRNPWDRLVSAFWHVARTDQYRTISDRSLPQVRPLFLAWLQERAAEWKPHNWLCDNHLYMDECQLYVDQVALYEELPQSYERICARLNVAALTLMHLNAVRLVPDHYSRYYNRKWRDWVAGQYETDIALFGYRFEVK